MAQLVTQRGRLSVAELSDTFHVTTETVRRDLSTLDRIGLIRRVHGGAVPVSSVAVIEAGLSERDLANTEAKDAIAAKAVTMLPPAGSVIILDAGSTTARLAACLPVDHRLTVITHAVPIAARLTGLPHIDLHLLPGRVRRTTHAAVGVDTVAALSELRADMAFIATNGLTVDHGLSTPDRDEAATKTAIIGAALNTVLVADSSKIGIESTLRFGNITQIDTFITDSALSKSNQLRIENAGTQVVIA